MSICFTLTRRTYYIVTWVVFLICLGLFLWRVFQSGCTWRSKALGTKVNVLHSSAVTPLPSVAVCRTQTNLVHQAVVKQLLYLKSYKEMEDGGFSYSDEFNSSLVDPKWLINGAWITVNSEEFLKQIIPPPGRTPESEPWWHSMYEPRVGKCIVWSPTHEHVETSFGEGGVRYINIQIGFPPEPPEDISTFELLDPDKTPIPDKYSEDMSLFVFERNSFYRTNHAVRLDLDEMLERGYSKSYKLSLGQEIVDQSDVNDQCNDEPDYNEDLCLERCLVHKTVSRLHCLHPRLAPLINDSHNFNICTYDDLSMIAPETDDDKLPDPGWTLINKEYMSKLSAARWSSNDDDGDEEEKSCSEKCKPRCRRRIFNLRFWGHTYKEGVYREPFNVSIAIDVTANEYKYHFLKTDDDFVADIGSYIGLFLGYSVYSVVDLIAKFVRKEGEKKRARSEEKKMAEEKGVEMEPMRA